MLVSALDDVAQQWPREVQMLGAAAKAGLAAQLTGRVERGATPVEATEGAARWLAAATLYDADTCKWLAGQFGLALGFELPVPAVEPEASEASTGEARDASSSAPPDEAAMAGIAPEPAGAAPAAAGSTGAALDEDDAKAAAWAGMSDLALRSNADEIGEITIVAPFVGTAAARGDARIATEADAPAPSRQEPKAPRTTAQAPPVASQPAPAAAAGRTSRGGGRKLAVVAGILVILAGGYFVAVHFAGWPPLKKASSTSGNPTIASLTPNAGPNVGGTQVTAQGSGLSNAVVTIGGKPVSATCSDTSCTFTVPAGSGSEQVRVQTAGGTATASYVYSSSPSPPPAWIASVFPDVSNNCTPYTADKSLVSGLTSSFTCGDTYLGSSGAVVGFQYDTAHDYESGLNHFNALFHFSPVTAGSCPPAGASGGQGWWYNSSFGEIQDQSVECLYTTGPSGTEAQGKTELFEFPSEDAMVMVWGPSLPWSALQDIWCQSCAGGPAATTTLAGSGNTGSTKTPSDGRIAAGTPLSVTQLLPSDVIPGADCRNWPPPHAIRTGITGSLECSNADLGGNGTVVAYKYGDSSSYTAGLAALNSAVGFNASSATGGCPPSGNVPGEIEWSNGDRYPRLASQVLECLMSANPVTGGTPGPLYIEAIPTQHAILEFSAPLLSWAELNNWYLSPADGLL